MAASASASVRAAGAATAGVGDGPGGGANLWQRLLRDSSVRTKLPVVNLVVLGDRASGKSALLRSLDERHRDDAHGPRSAAAAAAAATPAATTSSGDVAGDGEDAGVRGGGGGALDALLAYTTMHALDARAKERGAADAAEDVAALLETWVLRELPLAELLAIALKPPSLAQTIAVLVLDLSRPWTIKSALEQWTSALEGQLLARIQELPVEQRQPLYQAVKQHLLEYEDPSLDLSLPKAMEIDSKKEFLEDGALAKNLGIPLVIVVAKSDLRPESSVKMDYIEFVIRQFAIKYGAAVIYTSAKTGTNIDVLRKYILHRAHPAHFKFDHPPQLIERGAIFVPAGYDSFALVNQSIVGSQPKWPADKPFEKIVPAPSDEGDEANSSSTTTDTKLDPHEVWLEKLEKAAGAGLEELQKQSVEASKKAEAAAAARRAAAERRKREEKDVSSTHLANFFNNLLSRPEKSKSGRSLDAKKKDKSDSVKNLAEQELQNLTKKAGST